MKQGSRGGETNRENVQEKRLNALLRVWPGRASLFWLQFSSVQYPGGLRLQRAGYQTAGFPPARRKCRTAARLLFWGRCFQNLYDARSEEEETQHVKKKAQIQVTNTPSEFIDGSGGHLPIVVMIVPEKKKALARSHWLTKVRLLLGSTPAPTASTTSWDGTVEKNRS